MSVRLFNTPLHAQVRDQLLKRIEDDKWGVGDSHELSQEFGVSIGTVRKALEVLTFEKHITRRQGRGTFVAAKGDALLRRRFNRFRNTSGELIQFGAVEIVASEHLPSSEGTKASAPEER